MTRTISRPQGRLTTAALITTAALATALTGCSGTDSSDTTTSDQVASLDKAGDTGKKDSTPAKKYKAGSPELKKAQDTWHAEMDTCKTRTAQKIGIETHKVTDGKNAGEIEPKEDMGTVTFKDGTVEGSPLAKKWWTQVEEVCRKAHPFPEADDDTDKASQLATAKKQYECLKKAGLSDLHEPTNDNPTRFTPEGMQKYFGHDPDPKAQETLKNCGIS